MSNRPPGAAARGAAPDRNFWRSGCETCRASWFNHYTIDELLGIGGSFPTRVYRCVVCGTYWEEGQKWVIPVDEHRARELLGSKFPTSPPSAGS